MGSFFGEEIGMTASSDIKVIVASHKDYWMPSDAMYLPVQVGAKGNDFIPGFQRDDEGQNISSSNPRYCELTGLYWAWKNLKADYVGLAHYRRHFRGTGERGTLSDQEANELLGQAPVILPKKRKYYVETVQSHYAHTFDQAHLDIAREVLSEQSPDVLLAFDEHMKSTSAHIWNMAIMRRDIFDKWCSWLFPILEEIEKRIDFTDMTPFEERVLGRLSERLLDPWLDANNIPYVEVPVVGMEKINWPKKVSSFFAAKLLGKKYRESF